MKGLIITNPFDVNMSQRHKTRRMASELDNLGVFVDVVANDNFLAYIDNGEVTSDLKADFALYFDKDKYVAEMWENSALLCRGHCATTVKARYLGSISNVRRISWVFR